MSPPARSTPASCAKPATKTPSPAGARTTAGSSVAPSRAATSPRSATPPPCSRGARSPARSRPTTTLYCWGDNHFGQLAIGGDTVRATPAQVPGVAHAGALAAGGAHTCATASDADGAPALFCWGANDGGQLGNGTAGRRAQPDPHHLAGSDRASPPATRTPARFAADRKLRCWGWGASGQLGRDAGIRHGRHRPDRHRSGSPRGQRRRVRGRGGRLAHLRRRDDLGLAALLRPERRRPAGQRNARRSGRPRHGAVAAARGQPKALAAGGAHTCAVDADGKVWCWGRGDEGQLGDGMGREHASPDRDRAGAAAPSWRTAITAGAAHTCALAGGQVFCWGRNADGQIGARLLTPLLLPGLVRRLGQARAVAAGARHTCAIDDDGDRELLGRERERPARQRHHRLQQRRGAGRGADERRSDRRGRRARVRPPRRRHGLVLGRQHVGAARRRHHAFVRHVRCSPASPASKSRRGPRRCYCLPQWPRCATKR